jgi:hypothetical protein
MNLEYNWIVAVVCHGGGKSLPPGAHDIAAGEFVAG